MKKKICIATYVFGEKYQGFIPIYIYSILKTYPGYSVRIYVDRKVNSKIRKNLTKLEKLGDFQIIENFSKKSGLKKKALSNNMISRSLRWVFYDDVFSEFDYVYIGDIDIFVCKESFDLCKQHSRHAEFLALPYSNYYRGEQKFNNKDIKNIIKKGLKYGVKETIRMKNEDAIILSKLSGLHFIKVEPYFTKIKPLINSYIHELNLLAYSKSKKWNITYFNDEALLYELIADSGLGIPPKSESEYPNYMIINENPEEIDYRPHHGLHLGIWRRELKDVDSNMKIILDSELYRSYYSQFCKLRETDSTLVGILESSSKYITKIVNNMDMYYKRIKV